MNKLAILLSFIFFAAWQTMRAGSCSALIELERAAGIWDLTP